MIRLVYYGVPTSSPTLLAIPGIDGSSGSIAPIIEHLARKRQVVLVDYSGENNQTLEALTSDIVAAVRSKLSAPLDLLGQSIGTIIVAQAATLHDLPVRRVVLIGTFTRLRWKMLRLSNLVTRITPRPLYRLTAGPLMALVCGPVGDGRDHPFFAAAKLSDPAGVVRRTAWEIGRDFSSDLSRLKQPALVLMGARDRFVPHINGEIIKLRTLFSGRKVKVVAIPHAGHVLLPSAAIVAAVAQIEGFLS